MHSVVLRPRDAFAPQLLAASRQRATLVCWQGSPHQARHGNVHADDLRQVCAAAGDLDPFGIRIEGARIEGELDLRWFDLPVPLHLVGCRFSDPLRLEGAELKELVITDVDGRRTEHGAAQLPAGGRSLLHTLVGNAMRVHGDLIISGTSVVGGYATPASRRRTAAVWLADARIDGRLLIVASHFACTADRAIHADGMSVNGALRFIEGSSSIAELRLLRARIGGSLDLSGTRLKPRNGRALDLSEARIGSLFLIRDPVTGGAAVVHGRIKLDHAHIDGRLLIRGADLQAPTWDRGIEYYDVVRPGQVAAVIEGPGAAITGDLTVEPDVRISGGIVLPGATIGSVRASGAGLHHAHSVALDLSGSEIRAGIDLAGAVVRGMLDLTEARVTGSLDLTDAILSRPPGRSCVAAVGVTVSGAVELARTRVNGGALRFRSATIAGGVDAEGARITNPGGATINLHHASVGGNLRLNGGFTSIGVVELNRCDVAGRLRCEGGTFTWRARSPEPGQVGMAHAGTGDAGAVGDGNGDSADEGLANRAPGDRHSAVEAISATIHSGIGLGWTVPAGVVDLTDTRTSYLADDPEHDWPRRAYLAGFSYERFAPLDPAGGNGEWSAQARVRWLARVSPTDRRPWEQAARVLRSNGDGYGADAVLAAYRRAQRRQLPSRAWLRRGVDWLWDAAVMYGHRPQRALGILLALVIAFWVMLVPATVHDHLRAADAVGAVYSPSASLNVGGVRGPDGEACGGGRVRCFNPLYYSIDTIVPIIDLHQRSDWHPAPDTGGRTLDLALNAATVLGWLLSTVFALALARLGTSP